MRNVEKYCTAGHKLQLADAHCLLDTHGYKHTLRIFHTYYFLLQQWLYESESKYLACPVIPYYT